MSGRPAATRLPNSKTARLEFAETVGRDGLFLLQTLREHAELQDQPTVHTLQQVWEPHFSFTLGEPVELLRWRADNELPRAADAIESPYDPEARHSNKHQLS